MIKITRGNLLTADTDALVNTVNCEGFMGKGIALQFKQAFPANNIEYERACASGKVRPGTMFIHDNGQLANPRFIINFPTKRHWREKSKLEYITSGLESLVEDCRTLRIQSIAVPPLGCGLGGLKWSLVFPLIEKAFEALPETTALVYEPVGAPDAKTMPVNTKRPRMTQTRALVIRLMRAYAALDYSHTLLEVQKLAYFLQIAGEPMKLDYQAGRYGPYALNLNKVLETMEGHFLRGYGDSQKPNAELELISGATDEADDFLQTRGDSCRRLDQVAELIEGFETPYGMELLATVHWVATRDGEHGELRASSVDEAVARVKAWNIRKEAIFKAAHVARAWERLAQTPWIKLPVESKV